MTSELPEYAVARSASWFADGSALFVKHGGRWTDTTEGDWWPTDSGFWQAVPDAVVVALPTAQPLTREEAIADHAFNELGGDPDIPMRLLSRSLERRAKYRRVED